MIDWNKYISNPIKYVENCIKIIKEQNKNPRKITIFEALSNDRNILLLAEYNNEQIRNYEQRVIIALLNEK